MSATELSKAALELSADKRLELARRLMESVGMPASFNDTLAEGVRRIEDIAAGRITGLTDDQFRDALS